MQGGAMPISEYVKRVLATVLVVVLLWTLWSTRSILVLAFAAVGACEVSPFRARVFRCWPLLTGCKWLIFRGFVPRR